MSDYIYQNGRLISMDELMHSATYVGNASGGEYLQHWKYIKRVKKNGKWVYYYDKDALKKDVAKAKVNVKKAVDKALGYDKQREYNAKKLEYYRSGNRVNTYSKGEKPGKWDKSGNDPFAAGNAYRKTAAYQIEKAKETGDKIKNAAKETGDKIKKAAEETRIDVEKTIGTYQKRQKEEADRRLKSAQDRMIQNRLGAEGKTSADARAALRNLQKAQVESKAADELYRNTPLDRAERAADQMEKSLNRSVAEVKEVAETGKNTIEYLIEEYRRKKKK